MENLAGRKDCDTFIEAELKAANIEVYHHPGPLDNEVPASLTGELGPFRFVRHWYYWSVEGPVPLAVAQELYTHPIGRKEVRVTGDCSCPPPERHVIWAFPDGRIVMDAKEEAVFDEYIAKGRDWARVEKSKYAFSDDPESIGAKQCVVTYHIDSPEGLKLFTDTVIRHGLA